LRRKNSRIEIWASGLLGSSWKHLKMLNSKLNQQQQKSRSFKRKFRRYFKL